MNAVQRDRFRGGRGDGHGAALQPGQFSAGICLGRDYSFDLVRPGLALYGGIPRARGRGPYPPGRLSRGARWSSAGRSAPAKAAAMARPGSLTADTEAAIVNIGYADGYLRCFAGKGSASADGKPLPLIGRVSMDLVALDASAASGARGRRLGDARL